MIRNSNSLLTLSADSSPSAFQQTSTCSTNRSFQFVEYGQSFQQSSSSDDGDRRPAITCDGRVSGDVDLELTHWTDNATPDEYYADTSTGMALKLPPNILTDAVILNNHYDTDGVLSVYACLEPDMAQKYSDLLIEGAEAGDFNEWSSDRGIKLDATLCEILSRQTSSPDDEGAAYETAFQILPELLQDLTTAGGEAFRDYWQSTLDYAYRSWEALQDGSASIKLYHHQGAPTPSQPPSSDATGTLAVVFEPPGFSLSPFALHRGLLQRQKEEAESLDSNDKRDSIITRVLRVTRQKEKFRYAYEKPGHGWVQKLIDRPMILRVDASKLVQRLNAAAAASSATGSEGKWTVGGPSGSLVAICYTETATEDNPDTAARRLLKLEEELSSTLKR